MCGIPTSAECFEASPPLLPGASRAGCWLREARLIFHAPSQARHWLKIRTIMFWTLRCCDISSKICTRSLQGHTGLLCELFLPVVKGTCPPAVGYALSSCVLASHSLVVSIPGCFTFFTAVWHVFHPTFSGHLLDVNLHMFHHRFWSSTTFIDFNVNVPFRITVADQSIESAQFITSFWNAHKPLVIMRITVFHAFRDVHSSVNVLICGTLQVVPPCRNLQHLTLTHPSFSRVSSRLKSTQKYLLDDTFSVMSFLHGSDFSCLAHGNIPCAASRHAHLCLQLHRAWIGKQFPALLH